MLDNFSTTEKVGLGLLGAVGIGAAYYINLSKKKNSPYDLAIDGYRNLTTGGEFIKSPQVITVNRGDTIELVLSYIYFGDRQESVNVYAATWVEGNFSSVSEKDNAGINITLEKSLLPKRYTATIPIEISDTSETRYCLYWKMSGLVGDVVIMEKKLIDVISINGETDDTLEEGILGFENPVLTLVSPGPFMPGDPMEFEFQFAYSGDYARDVDVKLQLGKKGTVNVLGINFTDFKDMYASGETFIKYTENIAVQGNEYVIKKKVGLVWHIPSQELIDQYALGQNLDVSVIITNRGFDWEWSWSWEHAPGGIGETLMATVLENVIPITSSVGYFFDVDRPVLNRTTFFPGENAHIEIPVTNNSTMPIQVRTEIIITEEGLWGDTVGTYSKTNTFGVGQRINVPFDHIVVDRLRDDRHITVNLYVDEVKQKYEYFTMVYKEVSYDVDIDINNLSVNKTAALPGDAVLITIPLKNNAANSIPVDVDITIYAEGTISNPIAVYNKSTTIPGNTTVNINVNDTAQTWPHAEGMEQRDVVVTVKSGGTKTDKRKFSNVYQVFENFAFELLTPVATNISVILGQNAQITCPIRSLNPVDAAVIAHFQVYEDLGLIGADPIPPVYDKAYTIPAGQLVNFVVNHTTISRPHAERRIKVWVEMNGEIVATHLFGNIFSVVENVQTVDLFYQGLPSDLGFVEVTPNGVYGYHVNHMQYYPNTTVTLTAYVNNPANARFVKWLASGGLQLTTTQLASPTISITIPPYSSYLLTAEFEAISGGGDWPDGAPPCPAGGPWYWVTYNDGIQAWISQAALAAIMANNPYLIVGTDGPYYN